MPPPGARRARATCSGRRGGRGAGGRRRHPTSRCSSPHLPAARGSRIHQVAVASGCDHSAPSIECRTAGRARWTGLIPPRHAGQRGHHAQRGRQDGAEDGGHGVHHQHAQGRPCRTTRAGPAAGPPRPRPRAPVRPPPSRSDGAGPTRGPPASPPRAWRRSRPTSRPSSWRRRPPTASRSPPASTRPVPRDAVSGDVGWVHPDGGYAHCARAAATAARPAPRSPAGRAVRRAGSGGGAGPEGSDRGVPTEGGRRGGPSSAETGCAGAAHCDPDQAGAI